MAAAAAQEKGRGLSFAEQQMLRHGWEQGKGLGKEENGICEPIKVKVKCDKGGVGHKQSEQFTFHWWDHVFNKASSGLDVESGQDGVVVKKREGGEEEKGMISNKKPRKAMLKTSGLYGSFVKSATLLSGQEQPEHRSSSSEDSSSSDDDDDKLDLSSTTKLSDHALMKACGGRTAHKGARHGLTMSAKLARLEQQEQEFMAKYGKKEQAAKPASQSVENPNITEPNADSETVISTKHKKSKKKKRRSSEELSENPAQEDDTNIDPPQTKHNEEISKKQKKRFKQKPSDMPDTSMESEVANTEKRKKRKRKRTEKDLSSKEGVNGSNMLDEDSTESVQQSEEAAVADIDDIADDRICKKEKRKKKKRSEKSSVLEEGLNESSVVCSEDSRTTEAVEGHAQEQHDEGSVTLQLECDNVPKKKKKKKHSEPLKEESFSTELEINHSLEATTQDSSTKKKTNKKKKKKHEK